MVFQSGSQLRTAPERELIDLCDRNDSLDIGIWKEIDDVFLLELRSFLEINYIEIYAILSLIEAHLGLVLVSKWLGSVVGVNHQVEPLATSAAPCYAPWIFGQLD
jgi:hypothetical protein